MLEQRFRVPGRAWTLNVERRESWREHRERTAEWRNLTALVATGKMPAHLSGKLAPMEWADVHASVYQRHPLADTGNAYPTVKAIIDGLVDCGVLADDRGEFVRSITMHAPVRVDTATMEFVQVGLIGPERPERWRRWA